MVTHVVNQALRSAMVITLLLGVSLLALPSQAAGRGPASVADRTQNLLTTDASPATGPPFWLPMASMHSDCGCVATLGLDGRIYALGGTRDGSPTDAEVYTPATNTWFPIAPMLHSRSFFGAATGPDGAIYAIGGASNAPAVFTSTDAYVPTQNRWVPRSNGLTAHVGGSAVRGPDGRIYMIGGTDGDFGVSEVDAYDTHTQQWTHVTDLPTPRGDLGVAVGLDGRIYTVGGLGGTPGEFNDDTATEAYDVVTGQWIQLAALPWAREALAAVTGADGRIYALGGTIYYGDSTGPSFDVVDAYDPRTNRWQAVAPLRTPYHNLAAVRGPDGRIYAIGGAETAAGKATMEAYGPVIDLRPTQSAPGHAVVLTGTNFAANATVNVTWGAIPGGTVMGTARTDRAGNLPHTMTLVVPRGVRPGHYRITAEDERSRYPVTAAVTILPVTAFRSTPTPVYFPATSHSLAGHFLPSSRAIMARPCGGHARCQAGHGDEWRWQRVCLSGAVAGTAEKARLAS